MARHGALNVILAGDAQLARGYQASGNYFTVIGVSAALGRVFDEGDDRLGAPPVAVISHPYWKKRFAGESMRLVAIGVVLGLGAALWAGRFVETVVYGLSPNDPLTIAAAVVLIAGVTALASGLPARRASNVDPMEALREQ